MDASRERWEPLAPEQVAKLLVGFAAPWWIAGGWALDLFIGRQTRAHEDIDIAMFRDDLPALRTFLDGWALSIAERGVLAPWTEGPFPPAAHTLWSRERGREAWQLEIVVEERQGDRWSFRRDAEMGVRARDIGRLSTDGVPYLRPEIVLLYKSKHPRPSDETDFLTVLPQLDPAQRAFLAAGLWTIAPDHRWLARLR